jgi:hypothetical protein
MCMGSSAPSPAPTPTPPAPPAQQSDPSVQAARDSERQRRLRAAAGNDTLVNGGAGLTGAATTGLKTALGQ